MSQAVNIRVEYLKEPVEIPFHLGRLVNNGLRMAEGTIISVMDADLLLDTDFISRLDDFCRLHPEMVINLFRHMADRPYRVSYEHWKEQAIGFHNCLSVSPTRDQPIPKTVTNKGPLISAKSSAWRSVKGYDEHVIWTTGVTRLGQDVTARLEIFLGTESLTLPEAFAVHPWHPEGFYRDTLKSVRLLELQESLTEWSRRKVEPDWKKRLHFTDEVYRSNRALVDSVVAALGQPGQSDLLREMSGQSLASVARRVRLNRDKLLGKLYQKVGTRFLRRFRADPTVPRRD